MIRFSHDFLFYKHCIKTYTEKFLKQTKILYKKLCHILKKKQLAHIKKLVKAYINALEESNFPVSNAFIYGSYAKGNFRKGSDIDVCIVSKAYNPEDDGIRLLLWQKRRTIDARIEPVGYRPNDFNESSPLVSEIKQYGIKVL